MPIFIQYLVEVDAFSPKYSLKKSQAPYIQYTSQTTGGLSLENQVQSPQNDQNRPKLTNIA